MTQLRLVEVKSEEEFPAIAHVLYASFQEPFNPFWKILNNVEGTFEEQMERKAKSQASQWRKYSTTTQQQQQHWVKLVEKSGDADEEDEVVVAVSAWRIQTETCDAIAADPVAVWHPEGSLLREFATQWLKGMKSAKGPFKRHPHIGSSAAVSYCNHRWDSVANRNFQSSNKWPHYQVIDVGGVPPC